MNKAIVAFSGDPITKGHIDLIRRASLNFEVVLGIGENPKKKYTFSLEKRKAMAEEALRLSGLPNVTVKSFTGLLVDFAYENSIYNIIRGIRGVNDFADEDYLHLVNKNQTPRIETYYLFANKDFAHVSSSAVKELQRHQGQNILDYVTPNVKKELEREISGQYRLGVTGSIGAGKSHIVRRFMEYGKEIGLTVVNIDFDAIGHEILEKSWLAVDVDVRDALTQMFGLKIVEGEDDSDGFIDTKKLGSIIFSNNEALDDFNRVMMEPMHLKIRRKLTESKGLVLFNSALLAEMNCGYMCNNDVLLIDADEKIRHQRLVERGYTEEQISRRINSQMTARDKAIILSESIYGSVTKFTNNGNNEEEIKKLFEKVVSTYCGG